MDAELVSAWKDLCQQLAPAFTARTYVTFLHVVTGWVLCRSRPAVTGLVLTVGSRLLGHAAKHWTSYERFFHRAAWSLGDMSRLLLARVVVPLVDGFGERPEAGGPRQDGPPAVSLNIDDTTAARYGKHVAFAGYFKDASASNVMRKVCHWSHNWVIGCVHFRCRLWPDWVIGLPVWFALYRKPADCDPPDQRHPFRTRHELAAGMLAATRAAVPGREIEVGADGQYATKVLCGALDRPAGESLVSRIRSDAAVYALPPARRGRGRRGPPRKKGKRLPALRVMAARRKKGWRTVEVRAYGKTVKKRVLAIVCLWPHVCQYHPIKVLVVRDPAGKQKDDFLFCTDPAVPDERVVERMADRWPVEECIRDGKQHGGFEKVQGWCPRTVERQAPLALVVQTLVKAWYVRHAAGRGAARVRPKGHEACGWLTEPKAHPSYLDMLATLRRVLWEDRMKGINRNSTPAGRVRGWWKALQFTLCAAA
jgi:hypothetical protein